MPAPEFQDALSSAEAEVGTGTPLGESAERSFMPDDERGVAAGSPRGESRVHSRRESCPAYASTTNLNRAFGTALSGGLASIRNATQCDLVPLPRRRP